MTGRAGWLPEMMALSDLQGRSDRESLQGGLGDERERTVEGRAPSGAQRALGWEPAGGFQDQRGGQGSWSTGSRLGWARAEGRRRQTAAFLPTGVKSTAFILSAAVSLAVAAGGGGHKQWDKIHRFRL